jgi:hypothetical protein
VRQDFVGAKTEAHSQLRERVKTLIIVVLAADIVGWLLTLALSGTGESVWKAWAWSTSQLLVGGSTVQLDGESPWAELIEIGLQIIAVFVVAALAGSFGAFFHRRGLERSELL